MRRIPLLLLIGAMLAQPAWADGPVFKPGNPITDINPQPVKLKTWNGTAWIDGSSGGTAGGATAANQTGVGTAAQTVQGADANATVATANPVMGGCLASSAAPTSAAAGQNRRIWCGLNGQTYTALSNGGNPAAIITTNADAQASTASLGVWSQGAVWNGTSWDRQRGDATGTWVSGQYNVTLPTLTDTSRTQLQTDTSGNLRVRLAGAVTAGSDNFSNSLAWMNGSTTNTSAYLMPFANYVFNGTGWDRSRGDVNGSWVGGNVASGAADAGNPVKMGGVFNATAPTLTTGQRSDLQVNQRGTLMTQLTDGVNLSSIGTGIGADADPSRGGIYAYSRNSVYNGATWDRMRGDTNGAYVQFADSNGNRALTAAPTTDGLATLRGVATSSYNVVFNGTAWDRARGDASGTWVSGQYNATPPVLADLGRGQLQLDANGNLRSRLVANSGSSVDTVTNIGYATPTGGAGNLPIATVSSVYNNGSWDRQRGNTDGTAALTAATAAGTFSATVGSSSVAEAGRVVKAAGGNLYAFQVTTAATPGYVMVFNTTTIPADGAVTPSQCFVIAANSTIDKVFQMPLYLPAGISIAFSSTGCFTKTASATAFFATQAK